jgi:hypothetical protein
VNGSPSTLSVALQAHDLGICCIALKPASKKPASRWRHRQHRRPERQELVDIFDRSEFNLGFVCGAVSQNLVARDFDALGSYEKWAVEHPDLARRLPTVRTFRGHQVYFRTPYSVKSRRLLDGELRSEGNFVVAPPSLHPEGVFYEFVNELAELPVLGLGDFFQTQETRNLRDKPNVMCINTGIAVVTSIDDAITASLPTSFGTRNACLWMLVRFLRGLVPTAGKDELREIVKRWHKLALPKILTKQFSETWDDFCRAWHFVKRPAGQPTLANAVELTNTIGLPPFAERFTSERTRRLIKLCVALNQVHGGGSFPLGCRTAADHLGVGHMTAARMLKELVAGGVLIVTDPHFQMGKKAIEYRYCGMNLENLSQGIGTATKGPTSVRVALAEALSRLRLSPGGTARSKRESLPRR